MATYFMDLALENVKCFKGKQVVDLSDGNGKPARWTIILGENGTGKTTLLRSLTSFFIESEKDANKLTQSSENISFFLNTLENAYLKTDSIYEGILNKSGKIKQGYFISVNWSDEHERKVIKFDAWLAERKGIDIWGVTYGASRRMSDGSLTESKNSDPLATLFSDKATLLNAEAWLLETDFAIVNSKGDTKQFLQKRYELIKETLKNLLPDILDFRIREITKTQTQAAIEVQTPYGWVAMKELSYGYLTFIGWVVDLAARMFERYPDSDAPLQEPAIVLVDEIDLHLHPKWQRQIVEFLTKTFTETQFIVTAHSPLIVQAAEGANLVLLKREGDSVKIYNDMEREAITGWRVDQVLASDLFGLESTRPPSFDEPIAKQRSVMSKGILTERDEDELSKINRELEKMAITNDVSNESVKVLQRAMKILHPDDKD